MRWSLATSDEMLNLRFVYEDAVRVMESANNLRVPPLPAAVFMLQADVINGYRHALTHYLTIPLSSSFLMNSSLGTPYEKWAHFTNEDFCELSFSIHNLLRYTSRLFHETEAVSLRNQNRFEEMTARSNAYTSPIVEIRAPGRSVGLFVRSDQHVSIYSIHSGPIAVKVGMRRSADSATTYFRIVEHQGKSTESVITKEEYMFHTATIREERICIRDRGALSEIRRRGENELAELATLHDRFSKACRDHAQRSDIFAAFTNLNEGYWI